MKLRELQNLLYQRITDPDRTNESVGDERLPANHGACSRRWYTETIG